MPRIAHLITGLNTGGAEMALYRLLAGTDRARFDSVVISLMDEGSVGPMIRELGVPLHSLGMRGGLSGAFSALSRLVRLLRRESPDVLQTWLYHADLLGTAASKLAGVGVIAWNVRCSQPSETISASRPSPLLRVLSALSRVPRAVVVNSAAGREFHEALGYRPREWALIHNGFDLDEFRPSCAHRRRVREDLALAPDTPVIGMVARHDALKDHGTFLRAAHLLRRSRPDVVFVLVGRDVTAENAELTGLVAGLGLENSVRLLGPRRDVAALYPALEVATLSSIAEGFPNVVAEAMACGVPCVVTDVGDANMIVGDTGFVVPPREPEALAHAWGWLLSLSPERRAALGAASRSRIAAHFGVSAAVEKYESLYIRLAAERFSAPKNSRAHRRSERQP